MVVHPERLNIISLCTGGGGLDLGIQLALPAAHPVVLVEREAFAVGHLVEAIEQGLMAPAAIWSDVRTFDGRPWRGLVDGLVGGIPCQPHSLAGKRLGEDDERDLWSDARRIIVQARPWLVVIENVEGMLSSGGGERVCRGLRRLGFALEVGLFSAEEVGAPHERDRVFIVAVADASGAGHQGHQFGRTSRSVHGESASRPASELRAPCLDTDFPPRPDELDRWRDLVAKRPDLEPEVCRMADGLATRLDEIRLLGNGVVPLQAAYAFRTLCARLAATGSAGAVHLVRMMEQA